MGHILNEKKISGRSGHFSIHFFHEMADFITKMAILKMNIAS